jgi:hypothetical protein
MTFITILFFSIIITAVISIRYKIYLRKKITNPENKPFNFSDRPNLTDLLPMYTRFKPQAELKYRRAANIALGIFYLSLLIGAILIYFIRKYNKTF